MRSIKQAANLAITAMSSYAMNLRGSTAGAEDDWNSAIAAMGITQSLYEQILDPGFSDLRLTCNAQYWVIDAA